MTSYCEQALILLALFLSTITLGQNKFDTPYGNNDDVGSTVEINGAKMYYAEYGEEEPLLFIHGNGGNIGGSGNQIE